MAPCPLRTNTLTGNQENKWYNDEAHWKFISSYDEHIMLTYLYAVIPHLPLNAVVCFPKYFFCNDISANCVTKFQVKDYIIKISYEYKEGSVPLLHSHLSKGKMLFTALHTYL